MSVSAFLTRLYALAGVRQVAHDPDPVFDSVGTPGWGRLMGMRGGFEGISELRNVVFWMVAVLLLLLFAASTNPSESSFRSHLTELSFRRHLVDIRSSGDSSAVEDDSHVPSTPRPDHGTDTPPIAPFRFANHVAISLRTPTLLYKTFLLFSLAITSPLSPPPFLSDPAPGIRSKHASGPMPRDRIVVFFGFMGHWTLMGQVPRRAEWIWRLATEGGTEKGRKKGVVLDRAGVLEMRAVPGKEDLRAGVAKNAIALQSFASSKHLRKPDALIDSSDNTTLPLHTQSVPVPVTSFVSKSRSTSESIPVSSPVPPADVADMSSPVVTALKADLATAQAALAEHRGSLILHEGSVKNAHAHLQTTLEDLRTRRREDDAERQELKTRTKSLEEQKRQAEAARKEAEKKLRAVEGVRDGLEAKISAALNEIRDLKGNMLGSERNIRVVQEEGARYVLETRDAVEGKKAEMVDVEGQLIELEGVNEDLGKQVKEAEEKLQVVAQQGEEARRIGPEEEMMMMAAAYEQAAQEGYLYGHQQSHSNQWASQAAAYMAEAGMPYLDHSYTARSIQANPRSKFADLSGFEDFGPGHQSGKGDTTPPISDSESDIYGHDPGSPNGGISSSFSANLLPQGLFKSLEGDQTPLGPETDDEPIPSTLEEALKYDPPNGHAHAHVDGHDSSSESSEEHDMWRSPATFDKESRLVSGSHLAPPSTTPPGPAPSLPGLPALPGSHRWFSGTSSAENVNAFSFMQPTSTTSNDSLSLTGGYEASPFAPSASEKKALAAKWGPLSKYRWAGANRDGPSSLSRSSSTDLGASSGWLSSRFGSANGSANGSRDMEVKVDPDMAEQSGEEDERQDKKPFRFFSLRKPKE